MDQGGSNDPDTRMFGLILAQSALVGFSVGIFDSEIWIQDDEVWLNGFTYAMAAFFVQGIAYYVFKMFFEQSMLERAQSGQMERNRSSRYRQMQNNFDERRIEMELRMQEAQLEKELRWMEANPGQAPPSWGAMSDMPALQDQYRQDPNPPQHTATFQEPMSLGATTQSQRLKKDGTPDLRFNSNKE